MNSKETDLAILGAGAAGMMAALCAAERGMRVAIFDPMWSTANNLAISGGLIPIAGSRLQREAGIEDSPELWLSDLRAFAGSSVNERIAGSVATALPALLDFLIDKLDAPIRFLADVPAPGHSAIRFHATTPASGSALSAWLRSVVSAHKDIECHKDVGVDKIDRAKDGVTVHFGDETLKAKNLLLAGGGFGGAADLVSEFIPEMSGALHSGSPTNDGSVIALARSWGAAMSGMDGYQGQGHTNPEGNTRLGMSIPTLGGIMVNKHGQRFIREDIGPSALAAKVLAQPDQVALEVFDEVIESKLGNHSAYLAAKAAGKVMRAESIDELAKMAGVDAQLLGDSIKLSQLCAEGGASTSDPLGRQKFVQKLGAPYLASWVTGSLAHTQGGIVTDAHGRVLKADDTPIPHVFAAGGCAAGLSGFGGDGYLPGNGLAQSFGLAWLVVGVL